MGLSLVTPPDSEPITLSRAKGHLKQDDIDADDELITALISAVRVAAENYTNRAFVTQTWRQTFCDWCLRLEKAPAQSISAVRYVDVDGVTQTLAADQYQADLSGDHPAIIVPAYGATWPDFRTETLNPVSVEFVAGYADDEVPAPIISAMLLLLGHLYVNREAVNVGNIITEFPMSVRFLLDPYRVLVP